MDSVLLKIIPPQRRDDGSVTYDQSKGLSALQNAAKDQSQKCANIEKLGEYAWLIPLHTGLPFLSSLVYIADLNSFSYKVLYVKSDGDWREFVPPADSKGQ